MQGVQAWRLPVPTAASGRAQQRHAVRAKISHTGGSPGGPSRGLRAPFYRAWSTSDVVAALSPHRSRSSNSATALDGQAQTDNHEWAVQQGLSPDGLVCVIVAAQAIPPRLMPASRGKAAVHSLLRLSLALTAPSEHHRPGSAA